MWGVDLGYANNVTSTVPGQSERTPEPHLALSEHVHGPAVSSII